MKVYKAASGWLFTVECKVAKRALAGKLREAELPCGSPVCACTRQKEDLRGAGPARTDEIRSWKHAAHVGAGPEPVIPAAKAAESLAAAWRV